MLCIHFSKYFMQEFVDSSNIVRLFATFEIIQSNFGTEKDIWKFVIINDRAVFVTV